MKIDFNRSATGVAVGFAVLVWLIAFAGYAAPGVAAGNYVGRHFAYLVGTVAFGALLSVGFYGLMTAVRRRPIALRVAVALAAVPTLAVVHSTADLIAIRLYLRELFQVGPNALVSGEGIMFLNNMMMLTPTHVTYAVGVSLGFALRAVAEREQRLAGALAAAQEAQLAALRFQINPHFLFNSLNAVVALVGAGRSQEARDVVTRLAEFFRATLAAEPNAVVTLEEEFDLLAAYLDIEAARFGDRLHVAIDLPSDLAEARTPHLLLQPLVENAVKHAVAPSKSRVTIRISARREGTRLVLAVADDGAAGGGPGRRGLGVGLRNVEARLETLYGDRSRLSAAPGPRGYRAEVILPLEPDGEA
ncbi:histidine kinase [Phenylobacterium sp.]|uniref:sensor histidine kinase n=1 Tax=Phenylobacterium sp. TaxID=1871053 RepID=UPI00301BEF37